MSKKQELLDKLPEVILGIPKETFVDHFFDTRHYKPEKGEILAKYTAKAEFVEGREKMDIIHLLQIDKAFQAAQVMRKIHQAKEPDCYRLLREMCEDLATGMSEEEVNKKPYEFTLEAFFYTQKEHIPKNDPHWETIQLLEYDKENKQFVSKIEI